MDQAKTRKTRRRKKILTELWNKVNGQWVIDPRVKKHVDESKSFEELVLKLQSIHRDLRSEAKRKEIEGLSIKSDKILFTQNGIDYQNVLIDFTNPNSKKGIVFTL